MFCKQLLHIYLFHLILILLSYFGEGKPLQEPDFVSGWLYIESTQGNDRLNVSHNLAEMPVYVQVQVKSDPSNKNEYIFTCIGLVPRDDDQNDPYGGITYLYNESTVTISAYTVNNDYSGRVIYAENSQYWEGPIAFDSYSGYVRVRAWKGLSFPKPDYYISGVHISAARPVF